MIPFAGTNSSWMPTTITRRGRIGFSVGPEMIARILPLGQNAATAIVQQLGYGTSYTCGTAALNYTDCQYRLLLWQVPCPQTRPPLTQAFWDNLEPFLQTIYGSATPDLSSAISTIRAAKGLLKYYTGCDPVILNNLGYWLNSSQVAANCSQEFIDAMANFSNTACTGTDKNNPRWNSNTGCIAEQKFLQIPQPTAIQLRAYLMQAEGFNPLYTGYGFTSNDYYDPLQEEYWYVNDDIWNLDNYTVVKIYNGTALGLSYFS